MLKKFKSQVEKFYLGMVYALPAILFFSYYPLMHFGASESMNFEISLPLIWLVVFDILSLAMLVRRKKLGGIWQKWPWLLLPVFLTLSVFWSLNFLRGLLTVGIIWLLYFAVFSFYSLREILSKKNFRENLLKSLFCSALVVCFWCVLQCILDVVGISRDYTLMCAGCTYKTFGFPHPNGFAAEPQFMGNLLLAPTILSGWLIIQSNWKKWFKGLPEVTTEDEGASPVTTGASDPSPKITFSIALLFFAFSVTLFLTLSRGAIYAFVLAMMFLTALVIVKTKKSRALLLWPIILLAFLFTLNLQGIFAQVSKTNDDYISGVSKVINQLSLGVIDLGNRKPETQPNTQSETQPETKLEPKSETKSEAKEDTVKTETSTFDGYVEVSTNERLKFSAAALNIWRSDWKNVLFGVGIGGASNAFIINNITKKAEIVNNQYISLLLESGLVGVALLIFSLILVFRVIIKNTYWMPILVLMIAYLASLLFFAGLLNALHIYLLPAIFLHGKN